MRKFLRLFREERGAGAVEFALAAPVLFAFIIGIAQLGILFYANAGLKSAVSDAARFATIHPRPNADAIKQRITDQTFGLDPAYITAPTVVTEKQGTRDYVTITMTYAVPLDFIFFKTDPISITERRRVFVYPV